MQTKEDICALIYLQSNPDQAPTVPPDYVSPEFV
jgi:hypothetical protein